jgi:hypothetical protein
MQAILTKNEEEDLGRESAGKSRDVDFGGG